MRILQEILAIFLFVSILPNVLSCKNRASKASRTLDYGITETYGKCAMEWNCPSSTIRGKIDFRRLNITESICKQTLHNQEMARLRAEEICDDLTFLETSFSFSTYERENTVLTCTSGFGKKLCEQMEKILPEFKNEPYGNVAFARFLRKLQRLEFWSLYNRVAASNYRVSKEISQKAKGIADAFCHYFSNVKKWRVLQGQANASVQLIDAVPYRMWVLQVWHERWQRQIDESFVSEQPRKCKTPGAVTVLPY